MLNQDGDGHVAVDYSAEGHKNGGLHPRLSLNEEQTDWTYSMRREMQEIVSGLFLGPYSVAVRSKLEYLESHGITHIVCIRQDIEDRTIKTNFENKFQYLVVNIADSVTQNIIQFLKPIKDFLDNCFRQGGRALVHGNAGISRSAAVVLGFLMQKYNLSYDEAFRWVQIRRFCINPNEGFANQLREYEPIYRALSTGNRHQEQQSKRKRDGREDGDERDRNYTDDVQMTEH